MGVLDMLIKVVPRTDTYRNNYDKIKWGGEEHEEQASETIEETGLQYKQGNGRPQDD